jgi:hypothetical protein
MVWLHDVTKQINNVEIHIAVGMSGCWREVSIDRLYVLMQGEYYYNLCADHGHKINSGKEDWTRGKNIENGEVGIPSRLESEESSSSSRLKELMRKVRGAGVRG